MTLKLTTPIAILAAGACIGAGLAASGADGASSPDAPLLRQISSKLTTLDGHVQTVNQSLGASSGSSIASPSVTSSTARACRALAERSYDCPIP